MSKSPRVCPSIHCGFGKGPDGRGSNHCAHRHPSASQDHSENHHQQGPALSTIYPQDLCGSLPRYATLRPKPAGDHANLQRHHFQLRAVPESFCTTIADRSLLSDRPTHQRLARYRHTQRRDLGEHTPAGLRARLRPDLQDLPFFCPFALYMSVL